LKKIILITIVLIHISLSITSYFLFKKYEFIQPLLQIFIYNLVCCISFIFFIIIYTNFIKIERLIMAYVLAIIIVITITGKNLPNYTYTEAASIIEKENNEQVIEASKRDVKAQLGHYYIYTNDKIYLFNTETGDYASKLRDRN